MSLKVVKRNKVIVCGMGVGEVVVGGGVAISNFRKLLEYLG